MIKRFIRIALVLVVLLVIGVVAGFFFLNSLVKSGFEKIGPIVTKTEVKLESANLSPFSGNGELHGLFVGNPEGFKTPSAIKVGDIKVKLKLRSVTSDVVLVHSIEIESPEITFEGRLGGSNLSKLLDNINAIAGTDDSKTKPAEGGKKMKVESLVVKNARVNASITGMGGKTVSVSISDIHLTNIGMDENGVSTAELSRQLIREILVRTTKAVAGSTAGKIGGELKNSSSDAAEKTTKGIKNLFKK